MIVQNYPSICYDNFFEDPDSVRDYALSLNYKSCDLGNWPGERTENLRDINNEFYMMFITRFLRFYFNFDYEQLDFDAELYFQKTKFYFDEHDDDLNKGWIHVDGDSHMAGLVYLTPDCDSRSGTSIFSCNNLELGISRINLKHDLYSGKSVDVNEYRKHMVDDESNFKETIKFNNVYNRIISYDGTSFHRANYFGGSKNFERLTLVFFFKTLRPRTKIINRPHATLS